MFKCHDFLIVTVSSGHDKVFGQLIHNDGMVAHDGNLFWEGAKEADRALCFNGALSAMHDTFSQA
ncbi:Uncharacterised protein [Chlamydia trachomatis]|nr:Uncharacterised protein [Chlamydia trachomatis]